MTSKFQSIWAANQSEPLFAKGKQLVDITLANHAANNLGVNIQIVVHQRIAKANDLAPADQRVGDSSPRWARISDAW